MQKPSLKLRFGLVSLFIVVSGIATWLAFESVKAERVKRLKNAVTQHGGLVEYRSQFNDGRFIESPDAPLSKPPIIRNVVPDTWFKTPYHINLMGLDVSDADLSILIDAPETRLLSLGLTDVTDTGLIVVGRLTELESLGLEKTAISDAGLSNLKGLRKLKELDLRLTPISDDGLRHLHNLPELRYLYLTGTRVTWKGVKAFRAALPGCEVEFVE